MSEKTPTCPYCSKESALATFQPIGSLRIVVMLASVFAWLLIITSVPSFVDLFGRSGVFVAYTLVVVLSGPFAHSSWAFLRYNLIGQVVAFSIVEDGNGQRTFHVHTLKDRERWLDDHEWLQGEFATTKEKVILGVLYGGVLRRKKADTMLNWVAHRHPWKVIPGTKPDHLLLIPEDGIALHAHWTQILKIAERQLSYSGLYNARKEATKERDALAVELIGALDFLQDTRHSVGRSKKAAAKRLELEAFMEPFLECYEGRWRAAIELKLRRDAAPTEPDIQPLSEDFDDDVSGFILAER